MMAFSTVSKVSRKPLVIILGSTGTGKTKLSLQIAQKFGGEILSADSMQVYKNLDIITAKATKDERSLVRHHLIDVIDPSKAFTVVDFRNAAVNIIDDLLCKNKMAIVVGGTNYYIESLLWKVLVDDPGSMPGDVPLADCEPITAKRPRLDDDNNKVSSLELHRKLQDADPEMAKRLHPNNRRKILRSLEVLKQRGRPHSEILQLQQTSEGGSSLGGPLRYPDSIIFWLRCDQKILDERLDARVDEMITQGLLSELTEFHEKYNESRLKANTPPDYTKGIFQSIGFKEFHEYLILPEEERNTETAKNHLQRGIENLKMATRRYARKQIRWVSNRFLGRPDRQVPEVFGLDTSDVSKWRENVENPAFEIIENFLTQTECKYKPLPLKSSAEATSTNQQDDSYFCETCQRIFVGNFQWMEHKKSRKHKKMVAKKKQQQFENQEIETKESEKILETKNNEEETK